MRRLGSHSIPTQNWRSIGLSLWHHLDALHTQIGNILGRNSWFGYLTRPTGRILRHEVDNRNNTVIVRTQRYQYGGCESRKPPRKHHKVGWPYLYQIIHEWSLGDTQRNGQCTQPPRSISQLRNDRASLCKCALRPQQRYQTLILTNKGPWLMPGRYWKYFDRHKWVRVQLIVNVARPLDGRKRMTGLLAAWET